MTKKQYLDTLLMMHRIRAFEYKAVEFFETNVLRGSVHLCIGEEAAPATMANFITDEDYITSTHRGHGHCIAKGADVFKMMAEIFGKKDPEPNHGKPTRCGMWHLCFYAPDLEKTIAELNALGIPTDPIMVNASNGKRICFFYDPDGLPLELHE